MDIKYENVIHDFASKNSIVKIHLKEKKLYYKIFCDGNYYYEKRIGDLHKILNKALPLYIMKDANQNTVERIPIKDTDKEKELEEILSKFDSYKLIGKKEYEVTKDGYKMNIVVKDLSNFLYAYILSYHTLYQENVQKVKYDFNEKKINTLFALLKGMFEDINKIKKKNGGLFFDITYYEKGAKDIVKKVIKDKYRINLRIINF